MEERGEYVVKQESKRKRGGQPGNTNALKHGFYAKYFKSDEVEDMEALLSKGLEEEIATMRVIIRRVLQLADGIPDLDQGMRVLASFGTATARLAGMIKMQTILLDKPKDSFEEDLDKALEMVWEGINAENEKRMEEEGESELS